MGLDMIGCIIVEVLEQSREMFISHGDWVLFLFERLEKSIERDRDDMSPIIIRRKTKKWTAYLSQRAMSSVGSSSQPSGRGSGINGVWSSSSSDTSRGLSVVSITEFASRSNLRELLRIDRAGEESRRENEWVLRGRAGRASGFGSGTEK